MAGNIYKIFILILFVLCFYACQKKTESRIIRYTLYDFNVEFVDKFNAQFISRGSGLGIDLYSRGNFKFLSSDGKMTLNELVTYIENLDPRFYQEFIIGSKYSPVIIQMKGSDEEFLIGMVFNANSFNILYKSVNEQNNLLKDKSLVETIISYNEKYIHDIKNFTNSFLNEFLIIKFHNTEIFFIGNPFFVDSLEL